MDFENGYPYCAVKNGLADAFRQSGVDPSCGVVVGAGVTRSLIADEWAGRGRDPVDSAELGWLASTRLPESSRPPYWIEHL